MVLVECNSAFASRFRHIFNVCWRCLVWFLSLLLVVLASDRKREMGGAEKDSPGLHVPGVAHVDAALGCSLVRAILEGDYGLSGAHLFVAKVAHVLVRLLWADRWLSKGVCLF